LTLDGFRAVEVGGADAVAWLQDLVTADVAALTAGEAARSLLLGPTGRIRADLHVLREPEGLLLLQTLDQPVRVDDLLAPYVLSSDVVLLERPSPELVALPGVLGWAFRPTPPENLELVSAAALETWRIRRGIARFPVDLDEESLPAEAGLDDGVVIDREKGCFLGQESVAKVRNLGHPTRIVLALVAEGAVRAGVPVLSDGDEAGVVTSVGVPGGPGAVIARIGWVFRDADLRAGDVRLRR
jgi:folate-binding protein YgfZ